MIRLDKEEVKWFPLADAPLHTERESDMLPSMTDGEDAYVSSPADDLFKRWKL